MWCRCGSAVVLVALVQLHGDTGLVSECGGCCCSAVMLVTLVQLLAETSAWLAMGAALQCCSSTRRAGAAPSGDIGLVSEWRLLLL
jgi:hypothetical protein